MKVSFGARNAVRQAGAALGIDSARLNALARLVPLLSAPGAIEQALAKVPEQGIPDLSPGAEPYQTALAVASALEGLPQRFVAHPTGIVFAPEDAKAPGLLEWLPAHWVGQRGYPNERGLVSPRHPAVASVGEADGRSHGSGLGHPASMTASDSGWPVRSSGVEEGDAPEEVEPLPIESGGGPHLACQWDRDDLTALGVPKLDLSSSASLATAGAGERGERIGPIDALTRKAVEAGDTLGVAQLETIGLRMLLRRAREAYPSRGGEGFAVRSLDDLAQIIALWRPGAYSAAREESCFAARFGGAKSEHAHPALAEVLDPTGGQVLYEDQLWALVELLGADHASARRYVGAISAHRWQEREALEKRLRTDGKAKGWSEWQLDSLFTLLIEHSGYLFKRGHALALADRALAQVRRKADAARRVDFFAELLSCGGSAQYGMGSAAEEARRLGVAILPPCANRSQERFTFEETPSGSGLVGAVRVPLSAIRGLSPWVARHVLGMREAFGPFEGLLDFCRKVDPRIVRESDLLLLVKLGAFGFSGLSRAQLALAAGYYQSAAALLRSADRDPAGVPGGDGEAVDVLVRNVEVREWPPETIAAYELAHLGFYASAPREATAAGEALGASCTPIAELADYPHDAVASVFGTLTSMRVRTTRKGEAMAWLTVADGTGAIQCALFPRAYEQAARRFELREGALAAITGRMSHEDVGGPRLFVDELRVLGGQGARISALAVAVDGGE